MLNERQRGQLIACLLVLPPIFAWFVTAKLIYGFTPDNVRQRLAFLITHTLSLWPLWAALVAGLVIGAGLAVGGYFLSRGTFQGAPFEKFFRGTRLASGRELARQTRERGTQQITIADIPMPTAAERTHVSVGGATGTGKSTIFKEMMFGVMRRPNDRMVVLDPDGEFYSCFGRPGDKILNPFDARTEGWSFFNEIRVDYDFARYARSIIQPAQSAEAEEWHDYGRLLFEEVARRLYEVTHNPSLDDVFEWTNRRPADELEEFVKGTKAQSLFTGADQATASARFVLSNKLAPHLEMPEGDFSLRDWLDDPGGGNLFITWNENMRAALRPLITTWADAIFTSVLGMPSDSTRRIWVFLDELESLERLPTLGDALTKGRKKGLCIASGYQSYSQIEHVYGEKLAETMLSNHRTSIVLAVGRGGERTVQRMSKALGQHEVRRRPESTSHSWGHSARRNRNEKTAPESVVLPAEIMALPDLHGYLAYPGSLPVGRFKLEVTRYKRQQAVIGIQPADGAAVEVMND